MTFQPFAVQCQTCGRWLRVIDPSLIGTIAACPKCQSMVQVERPASLALGQSSVDSQAITEDAIESAEPDAAATEAPGLSGEVFSHAAAEASEPRPESSPAWIGPGSQRYRQVAVVAAISLSGLLIAAALFTWFIHRYRPGLPAAAMVTETPEPTDPLSSADRPNPAASNPDTPVSDASLSDPPADGSGAAEGDKLVGPGGGVEESSEAAPDDADEPAQAGASSQDFPADRESDRSTRTDASGSPDPSDLLPASPLEPAAPTSAPADRADNADERDNDGDSDGDPEGTSGLQELPPELAQYTQFLIQDGSLDKPNLAAPPTIDQVALDEAASEEEFDAGSARPRQLNVRGDLGIRLALRTQGYPPTDLLLLIGQLTTIPIEVDWKSFDLLGTALGENIPVPGGALTAGQLLDSISGSIDASWRQEETLLVVAPTEERFATVVATATDLSDFDQQQASATRFLTSLLSPGEEPVGEKLVVGESRRDQQWAVLAAESLRRMRGIEPKLRLGATQFGRWAAEAGSAQVDWPPLEGGVPPSSIDAPISLAGLLLRVSRDNQATVLVNWHDVIRRGAGPETTVLPDVQADAGQTLDHVLRRWNLQVRVAGDGYWWVGSEATYDRLAVLAWTPPLGAQRGLLEQRIADLIANHSADDIHAVRDEVSDRILLRLPRYLARQLPKLFAGG